MSDTILEAAARALGETEDLLDVRCGDDEDAQKIVHAVLVAVTPLIRAQALEEAARVVDELGWDHYASPADYSAAIRTLKEQP